MPITNLYTPVSNVVDNTIIENAIIKKNGNGLITINGDGKVLLDSTTDNVSASCIWGTVGQPNGSWTFRTRINPVGGIVNGSFPITIFASSYNDSSLNSPKLFTSDDTELSNLIVAQILFTDYGNGIKKMSISHRRKSDNSLLYWSIAPPYWGRWVASQEDCRDWYDYYEYYIEIERKANGNIALRLLDLEYNVLVGTVDIQASEIKDGQLWICIGDFLSADVVRYNSKAYLSEIYGLGDGVCSAIAPVKIISPTDGLIISNPKPTIEFKVPWDNKNSGIHFQILIDNNSDFSSPEILANSSISQVGWQYAYKLFDYKDFPSSGVIANGLSRVKYTVQNNLSPSQYFLKILSGKEGY